MLIIIELFTDGIFELCTLSVRLNHFMQATSATDWSMKYSRRSKGLSAEKVANYGRQVLEVSPMHVERNLIALSHTHTHTITHTHRPWCSSTNKASLFLVMFRVVTSLSRMVCAGWVAMRTHSLVTKPVSTNSAKSF